jgi:hypothetical protein
MSSKKNYCKVVNQKPKMRREMEETEQIMARWLNAN